MVTWAPFFTSPQEGEKEVCPSVLMVRPPTLNVRFGQLPLLLPTWPDTDTGCAAWVTLTVRPATVRVPVRDEFVVLAATAYVVVPLPVPLATEVIVSQDVAVDAVHVHVGADAVTPI